MGRPGAGGGGRAGGGNPGGSRGGGRAGGGFRPTGSGGGGRPGGSRGTGGGMGPGVGPGMGGGMGPGMGGPRRPRRRFFGGFGGMWGRRPRFFGGTGGCCSGCLLPFIIIIVIIFVIVSMISGFGRNLFGGSSDTEYYDEGYVENTVSPSASSSDGTREKAQTGVSFDSDCIVDELGWVENVSSTGEELKTFYDETGVQPYVYFKAYDASLTTDDEKEEYAESWYDDNIDNEGTFLYIYFAEEDASNDIGYMYCVDGYQIESVMDSEAIEIFWNYVNEYWYDGNLSTDEFLVDVFDSTAEAIM